MKNKNQFFFNISLITTVLIFSFLLLSNQVQAASPPSGLSASCPSPGTTATVSWRAVPGATSYALRVDNQNNGWNGLCGGSQLSGDVCREVSGTSYSFSSTPGASYRWWIHTCTSSGCDYSTVASSSFTCATTPTYTLNVTKTGSGSGTVTSSPSGINCGSTCSANFNSGTKVTLTAYPDPGSVISNWSGSGIACSGSGTTCTILNMDSAKNVTITFSKAQVKYPLTVCRSGTGSGSVISSPAGINCGPGCNCQTVNFDSGTQVTLTASGDFSQWAGGDCSGTNRVCYINMNIPKSVTANFISPVAVPTNLSATNCRWMGNSVVVDLNWQDNTASYYSIRVDGNPSSWNDSYWSTHCGSTSLVEYGNDKCQNQVYSHSITISIEPGATYQWWVHSRSASGEWSSPAISSFRCVASNAPDRPSNLTATCQNNGNSILLGWSAVPDPTPGNGPITYHLRVDENPHSWDDNFWAENCFSTNTQGWRTYPGSQGSDYCQSVGLTTTQKTLNIKPNTNYGWWVHARDETTGFWSSDAYYPLNVNCQSCSCSSWSNQGCGQGGCASNKMYQVRSCTPSGCASQSQCVDNSTCTPSNNPPLINNLRITQPDYCVYSNLSTIFSWSFSDPDGDSQSAYQIQIDNNSNFSSPEVSRKINSSSSTSYATQPGDLFYGNTYYWRVKVWDSKGVESNWTNGSSFSTPLHAYPLPDFIWNPSQPIVEKEVLFTDKSSVYDGALTWLWTFENGTPSTSSDRNPVIKFNSPGQHRVTLKITDSDGYSCSIQKTITVGKSSIIPRWREIAPF